MDTLEVFGSRVRGDARQRSDIDVLVTFTETPDLPTFIALEDELSDKLGARVDLVMRRSLKSFDGAPAGLLERIEELFEGVDFAPVPPSACPTRNARFPVPHIYRARNREPMSAPTDVTCLPPAVAFASPAARGGALYGAKVRAGVARGFRSKCAPGAERRSGDPAIGKLDLTTCRSERPTALSDLRPRSLFVQAVP